MGPGIGNNPVLYSAEYTSPAAMLVESYALSTVSALAFAISTTEATAEWPFDALFDAVSIQVDVRYRLFSTGCSIVH
jgi:hypothetical protein